MTDVPSASGDKSKAACDYIEESLAGLNKLKTAVCTDAGSPGPVVEPAADATKLKATLDPLLETIKSKNKSTAGIPALALNVDGDTLKLSGGDDAPAEVVVPVKVTTKEGLIEFITTNAENLGVVIGPGLEGGRRGKRSARRGHGRKSSKGGRRSFKGGRRSRARKGNKGRKSRGRTIKGGAKMSKELKAWMKRQKAATGIAPISKKTIDATKTTSQATGSEQRSDSGKYVEATKRGL